MHEMNVVGAIAGRDLLKFFRDPARMVASVVFPFFMIFLLGGTLQLNLGQSEEYQRRHDIIWPELVDLLHETGIRDYSIFLDEETNALFGILEIDQPTRLDDLPNHPVMQRWWAFMADIMETNPNNEPVSLPLREVFYLK